MFGLFGEGRKIVARVFPTAILPAIEFNGYPYDLDGSLSYARPKTGLDYFPWVGGDGTIAQIGAVSGFMQQQDVRVWSQMTGKNPFGPGSTTMPLNLQWQMTPPGLIKSF
jgi:hypothetical protein